MHDVVAQPNEEPTLPRVRADAHLEDAWGRARTPTLSTDQERLLVALAVPGRIGALPLDADELEPEPIVSAAARAGAAVTLRENAQRAGLEDLAHAAETAWQRQRFVARERLNTASRAAQRIYRRLGTAPIALRALASADVLHGRPETRLVDEVALLVPVGRMGDALEVLEGLRGVAVSDHLLPGRAAVLAHDAVWLRASAPTEQGWRRPAVEDLALMAAWTATTASGLERLMALADLALLTGDRRLHWETVAQRAGIWRIQPNLWRGCLEARHRTGALIEDQVMARLRPGRWTRIVDALFGT